MENCERELSWRSETVKEHLILISSYNRLPNESDRQEFLKFLTKGVSYHSLSSLEFSHICYFLLGIINHEERNKLIRWPLLTKQDQTKFRKGVKTLIDEAIEKYPWADIKNLPESYFLQPFGKQKRVLDFILSLTGLIIHLLLNDPTVLVKSSKEGLSLNDVDQMVEIVQSARLNEERIIDENIFPLRDFERMKDDVSRSCINFKQENDQLELELKKIKKELISKNIIGDINDDINHLQEASDSKISELKNLNKELKLYSDKSSELSLKLKAANEPKSLSIRDFNCDNSSELAKATSDACENLNQILEQLKLKQGSINEENEYLENLKSVKNLLIEERDVLSEVLEKLN